MITVTTTEDVTRTLFNRYVRDYAAEFSALSISDDAKKRAMVTGLKRYAPGIRAIAVGVVSGDRVINGRIDYVSAIHPSLGFVEVHIDQDTPQEAV